MDTRIFESYPSDVESDVKRRIRTNSLNVRGSDQRTINMDVIGTKAALIGDRLARVAREMADESGTSIARAIDRETQEWKSTPYYAFERLQAAWRFLRAAGANADQDA